MGQDHVIREFRFSLSTESRLELLHAKTASLHLLASTTKTVRFNSHGSMYTRRAAYLARAAEDRLNLIFVDARQAPEFPKFYILDALRRPLQKAPVSRVLF